MSEETRFDKLMDAMNPDDESVVENQKSKSQKPLPKSKDPDYAQIGLYLPVDVHKKMKIASATTGVEMSAIAEAGILMWLEKNKLDS